MPQDPILELDNEEVGVDNTIYKMSEAADWDKIDKHNLTDNKNNGRTIEPVPWKSFCRSVVCLCHYIKMMPTLASSNVDWQ